MTEISSRPCGPQPMTAQLSGGRVPVPFGLLLGPERMRPSCHHGRDGTALQKIPAGKSMTNASPALHMIPHGGWNAAGSGKFTTFSPSSLKKANNDKKV